jgi:phosphonopyruvate decarboxylase
VLQLNDKNEFPRVFEEINCKNVLTFLQINVKIGSRSDLGRPKTTPQQNKSALMEALNGDLP